MPILGTDDWEGGKEEDDKGAEGRNLNFFGEGKDGKGKGYVGLDPVVQVCEWGDSGEKKRVKGRVKEKKDYKGESGKGKGESEGRKSMENDWKEQEEGRKVMVRGVGWKKVLTKQTSLKRSVWYRGS